MGLHVRSPAFPCALQEEHAREYLTKTFVPLLEEAKVRVWLD